MKMTTPLPADGIQPTPIPSSAADGRSLRRERNVDAARGAVVALLSEGSRPSLAEIAERAGIATRSVYRYFGDAESAITDAVEHRIERAQAVFESEPEISSAMPFDERLAMLILRRLRLERLTEPLSTAIVLPATGTVAESIERLDDEVRRTFAPELADHPDDVQLERLLCAVFRLRSVRSMRWAFDDSDSDTASALSRSVSALMADADSRPTS